MVAFIPEMFEGPIAWLSGQSAGLSLKHNGEVLPAVPVRGMPKLRAFMGLRANCCAGLHLYQWYRDLSDQDAFPA